MIDASEAAGHTNIPRVAGEFVHERAPRPEWVAALREHSVLTDTHGMLEIVWEPGDPWIPGQRWTLWEMVSPDHVDYETLLALRGPHPRGEGHMCTSITVPGQFQCLCKVKYEGWRGSPNEGVNLTQWKLFQRTGKVGRLFWVIQGNRGGHKAFLSSEEQKFLQAAGRSTKMPALGDLPYADFDTRVLAHVIRFNRLRQMSLSLREFRQRMQGSGYQLHQKQVARDMRADLVKWLDEQMQESNELFIDAARKGEFDGHSERTEIDWEKVGEAGVANYVETGQLLHPSKVK